MPDLKAMVAPFAEEEIRHYEKSWKDKQGRDRSMTFTYVEDETVMDRLDLGFGMGNWQVHVEPFPYVEGVVKVRLGVRIDPEMEWIWQEDFGYPSNKDGEALKEAVSDGIRRCGRYLGIARDLYRKDVAPQNGPATRPVPVQPAPARSSTALPEGPDLSWDVLSTKKPEPFGATLAQTRDIDGTMTAGELLDRAKAASVPLKVLGDTSKRLYGQQAWKLIDLTDVQRYAVAIEVGLA